MKRKKNEKYMSTWNEVCNNYAVKLQKAGFLFVFSLWRSHWKSLSSKNGSHKKMRAILLIWEPLVLKLLSGFKKPALWRVLKQKLPGRHLIWWFREMLCRGRRFPSRNHTNYWQLIHRRPILIKVLKKRRSSSERNTSHAYLLKYWNN